MNKTVLITGSAGFIGFHLSKFLLDSGFCVVGLDNFNSYYSVDLKETRNSILDGYENFQLYRGDLSDLSFVENVFSKHGFDIVVNLAAQAGVRYSLKNPHAYIQSNVVGFTNLIEEVKNCKVKKFIYASSSSVYGDNNQAPYVVEGITDKPASLYAATKKANEMIAEAYSYNYGINCIGLRFFTVYGPFGRPDMAYFSFTDAIKNNRPLDLFAPDKMVRDFTYIDDIIDGIYALISRDLDGCRLYNLGNDNPVLMSDFVDILENILGKKVEKNILSKQTSDVWATHADISLSRKDFGFSPKVGIKDGLRRFVKWHNEYYGY